MAADIHLVFDVAGGGSLSGESGSLISSQLNSIINAINAKKFKIKVEIDAAHLNKQINQLLSKQLKATGIKTTAQNSGVSGAIKARAAELQTQRAMLSKMASEVSSAYSKVQKSMSIMGTGKQYAELQRLKLLMDDINRAKNTRGYNTTATMRDLDKRVASARQYVAALKEQEGAAKRAAAAEEKRAAAEQKAKAQAAKSAAASKMTADQTKNNLLTIQKAQNDTNKKLNTAEAAGVRSSWTDALVKQKADLSSLYAQVKAGTISNEQFAASMQTVSKTLAAASGAIERHVGIANAFSNAEKKMAQEAERAAAAKQKANTVLKTENADYYKSLIAVDNLLSQVTNAQKNWTKAKSGKTSQNYKELSEYRDALERLRASLNGMPKKNFAAQITSIRSGFKQTSSAIIEADKNTKSLSDRLTGLAQKFSAWLGVSQVIMFGIRSIRSMISTSIELDDAFTQLDIVTHASEASMQSYANNIAESATKIGSSISDLVDSTTTYARLGYNLEESSKLAEFTAMLQNVGDIEVGDAQNAVTAIVKAFDVDVSDIESVMDKLVTTGRHNCPTA